MSTLREAAQDALTAYETFRDVDDIDGLDDAIDRLRAALAKPELEPPRDEWRPASEPPEDGRDVVVWCAQERRAVHGMYVRRHPPVVGLVDGWVAPDASKLTHWRDVTPPGSDNIHNIRPLYAHPPRSFDTGAMDVLGGWRKCRSCDKWVAPKYGCDYDCPGSSK